VTTIKKILCAIDLTKASRNAFDRALGIARVSNARLYVLQAVAPNDPFSWQQRDRLELPTRLRERAEREGVPCGRSSSTATANQPACPQPRLTWSVGRVTTTANTAA
jgi:nucleotide-binding universal stress UspA family protein